LFPEGERGTPDCAKASRRRNAFEVEKGTKRGAYATFKKGKKRPLKEKGSPGKDKA